MKKPRLKDRIQFLLTGKLPCAKPETIQRHVQPYLTNPVQVGSEIFYRVTEWAYKPITANHPTFKDKDGNPVKVWEAFEVDGEKYYTCDPDSLPSYRYRIWALVQEEWQLGLSREFLDSFIDTMNKIWNGDDRAAEDGYRAFQEFKTRYRLVRTENQMYQIISLVYFTMDEDLATYDFNYNRKKIEKWQNSQAPHDFFFGRRMLELLNLDFKSKTDLETWMKQIKLADLMLKKGLLYSLSSTLEGK